MVLYISIKKEYPVPSRKAASRRRRPCWPPPFQAGRQQAAAALAGWHGRSGRQWALSSRGTGTCPLHSDSRNGNMAGRRPDRRWNVTRNHEQERQVPNEDGTCGGEHTSGEVRSRRSRSLVALAGCPEPRTPSPRMANPALPLRSAAASRRRRKCPRPPYAASSGVVTVSQSC
jgi:hypothetical protein